jgi:hypothetical protein
VAHPSSFGDDEDVIEEEEVAHGGGRLRAPDDPRHLPLVDQPPRGLHQLLRSHNVHPPLSSCALVRVSCRVCRVVACLGEAGDALLDLEQLLHVFGPPPVFVDLDRHLPARARTATRTHAHV